MVFHTTEKLNNKNIFSFIIFRIFSEFGQISADLRIHIFGRWNHPIRQRSSLRTGRSTCRWNWSTKSGKFFGIFGSRGNLSWDRSRFCRRRTGKMGSHQYRAIAQVSKMYYHVQLKGFWCFKLKLTFPLLMSTLLKVHILSI